MSRRDHKGLWQPGKSGNPSGRPKAAHDIQALAREYGPTAIETLAWIAANGDTHQARISAAQALLDRGYGKPVQTSNLNVTQTDVRRLTDEDIARGLARIQNALGGGASEESRPSITH